MRTMNKIVALSLVLAMAFSMMASAASFKDQATINADLMDEINLLVALGVYSENGTGAGYFEPNGTITRSQAAKIIYVLKNKGVDNGATSWTGLNIFNDVEAGAWYEGYVNYCASVGILAGVGDNNFAPNGTLTGVELAKMLLVVIGYKADIEGYTGAKWDANILADAEAAGFFVDYELPVRGVVTREWAAQMIVNALNATKVKYEDGEAVEMYNIDNAPITYAGQDLGLIKRTAQLVATPNVTLGVGADNENGKKEVSKVGNVEYKYAAALELLGQNVDVLYKANGKVYGITADEAVEVLDTTIDAVKYDAKTFDANFVMYTDYVVDAKFDETKDFGVNLPYAVKLIDNNGDGKWDLGFKASVTYDKVNYINPAKNTIRFATNNTLNVENKAEDYAKFNFVDTVAKNDIVKITYDHTSGKVVKNIEKLDVVTGAITKVVDNKTATIDGGSYLKSAVTYGDVTLAVNKTAQDYFVDGKYVVAAAAINAKAALPTNMAIVLNKAEVAKTDVFGNATNEKTPKVEVLLNDGTQAVYEYNVKINESKAVAFDKIDAAATTIYAYEIKDGKIVLTAIEEKFAGTFTTAKFDESESKIAVDGATYLEGDDTFFFVKKTDSNKKVTYAVMTAAELSQDANFIGKNFVKNADGFNYVVAAIIEGVEAEAKVNFAIASGSVSEEIVEGKTYYFIEVTNVDATTTTLKLESKPSVAYKYVTYTVDSKGIATVKEAKFADLGVTTRGVLSHFEGNKVVINGTYLELAEKVEIYYIDAYKTSTGEMRATFVENDGLVLSAKDLQEKDIQSVIYGMDKENKFVAKVLVEIDGEYIWSGSQLGTK